MMGTADLHTGLVVVTIDHLNVLFAGTMHTAVAYGPHVRLASQLAATATPSALGSVNHRARDACNFLRRSEQTHARIPFPEGLPVNYRVANRLEMAAVMRPDAS